MQDKYYEIAINRVANVPKKLERFVPNKIISKTGQRKLN